MLLETVLFFLHKLCDIWIYSIGKKKCKNARRFQFQPAVSSSEFLLLQINFDISLLKSIHL